MEIDRDTLTAYGGVAKKYEKGDFIFHQGDIPVYFLYVISGEVKMFSSNKEGKELTQGFFSSGKTFGEAPLFLNKEYPSSAEAFTDTVIMKISRERFFYLLDENTDVVKSLLYVFASRIYTKASTANMLMCHSPEEKIIDFFEKIKRELNRSDECLIPYTRQEMAHATGLRVETIIRTLLRMSKLNQVKIIDHKIFY